MDRRRFLRGTIAGSISLVAGCAFQGLPAGVRDVRFSVRDVDVSNDDGIDFDVACEHDTVTVSGEIQVGSSECMEATLTDVSMDTETLRVGISHGDPGSIAFPGVSTGCTDDLSRDGYTLEVEFDGQLPDTVVVTHDPYAKSTVQGSRNVPCARETPTR